MKLLLKRKPRSLILASEDHVLVIRSYNPRGPLELRIQCVVQFAGKHDIDMRGCIALPVECYGCLGLINAGPDVFLGVITNRSKAATPKPNHTVWRVHAAEFYCLTRSHWDDYDFQTPDPAVGEHPCAGIRKLMCSGSFFYSTDFDLTAAIQNETRLNFGTPVDESFMWNLYMIRELNKFRSRLAPTEQKLMDANGFLTYVIRGFSGSVDIKIGKRHGILSIISRQSWKRAGTRYNSRGIDDEGNVANFVETETVVWLEDQQQFGYVQLRGSVPVFWEQDANPLLGAKLELTRSFEASQPAFDRHFESLVERFGAVHVVNLLANKSGEAELTEAYKKHLDVQGSHSSKYTHFDFHREVSAGQGFSEANRVITKIQDSMLEFGFYSFNALKGSNETDQVGVFRVNCLDCLDRTNLVQQLISKDALDLFLEFYQLYPDDDFWLMHARLWADNGDQLSLNYAGTGALKTSFTRSGKMNIAGALSDMTKSVTRLYANNFTDRSKQQTIDLLLGRGEGQLQVTIFDPINDYVQDELARRKGEYSAPHNIEVFAGTFNVNGKMPDKLHLEDWLFPSEMEQYPDLYMIGFQELVDLTPGQILNADSTRRLFWEEAIGRCLNKHTSYVLMRSGQLVGTAIMLFVKRSEINHITSVEGTSKKTAFGGMAGNKGGVALSFMYASTSMLFINAHLAAGINNVEERHNDYKLLSKGLRFSRGRRIKEHDTVIWVGDFNYRVDLPNDTVRNMIESGSKEKAIQRLLDHDQLSRQMERGETFPFYSEMEIRFMPTYKFDVGADTYDTSEKSRTPSWTDRILCRGSNLQQYAYNSAHSFRFSDHRPVYALYKVTVAVVDEAKRSLLAEELYHKRRKQMGDANYIVNLDVLTPVSLTGIGLPHPSSDNQKWWIAGEGQTAKVPVLPPRPNMVLNPEKVNPFTSEAKNLPDFIDIGSLDINSASPQLCTEAGKARSRNGANFTSTSDVSSVSASESIRSMSTTNSEKKQPSLLDMDHGTLPYKSLMD